MNKTRSRVASFVLRFTQDLWEGTNGQPRIRWRGSIRYVQGNEEDRFVDFSQAVEFMQRNLAELTLDNISGNSMNQEEVLRESFKFWEDFSTVYSGMMFEALEHSLKQSESVKKQMQEAVEKTVKTWYPSPEQTQDPQNQSLVEMIQALQQQINTLTQKVEGLEAAMDKQPPSS